MQTNENQFRLNGKGARFQVRPSGFLGRLLTFVTSAVLLVAGFFFSLLVFAAVATAGLFAGLYLWWKTRELRRRMREQPAGGRVIEGEVIHDEFQR